jgi:hypothetical protein
MHTDTGAQNYNLLYLCVMGKQDVCAYKEHCVVNPSVSTLLEIFL